MADTCSVHPVGHYVCTMCGGTFGRVVSDEVAAAEAREVFGMENPQEEGDLVCDDCYKKAMADPRITPFLQGPLPNLFDGLKVIKFSIIGLTDHDSPTCPRPRGDWNKARRRQKKQRKMAAKGRWTFPCFRTVCFYPLWGDSPPERCRKVHGRWKKIPWIEGQK